MHDNYDVELLRFGPEGIEFFRAVVVAVDVGADVAAAEIQITYGALEYLGGARGVMQRHRRHADEAVGIAFDQVGDAVIVNVAPVLALFCR